MIHQKINHPKILDGVLGGAVDEAAEGLVEVAGGSEYIAVNEV